MLVNPGDPEVPQYRFRPVGEVRERGGAGDGDEGVWLRWGVHSG
jgi:hypothetical protein